MYHKVKVNKMNCEFTTFSTVFQPGKADTSNENEVV